LERVTAAPVLERLLAAGLDPERVAEIAADLACLDAAFCSTVDRAARVGALWELVLEDERGRASADVLAVLVPAAFVASEHAAALGRRRDVLRTRARRAARAARRAEA